MAATRGCVSYGVATRRDQKPSINSRFCVEILLLLVSDHGKVIHSVSEKTTLNVLIVEDEPIFRMDLSMNLKSLGFDGIEETIYAEDVIATPDICRYDLVLMDIRLKGELTGLDAAQKIASVCTTPIMIISAYQLDVDEVRKKVPTLIGFASKPIDNRLLRECIDGVIRSAHG